MIVPRASIVLKLHLETVLVKWTRKNLANLDLQRCMAILESAIAHSSQLNTKNNYKAVPQIPKSAGIHNSELNTQNNYKDVPEYMSQQSYTVQNWTHKIIPIYFMNKHNRTTRPNCWTCLVPNHDTCLKGPNSSLLDCIKYICIIPHIICNTLTQIHCHEWYYGIYLLNIWKWMMLIKGILNGHTQGKHELKKVEMLVF